MANSKGRPLAVSCRTVWQPPAVQRPNLELVASTSLHPPCQVHPVLVQAHTRLLEHPRTTAAVVGLLETPFVIPTMPQSNPHQRYRTLAMLTLGDGEAVMEQRPCTPCPLMRQVTASCTRILELRNSPISLRRHAQHRKSGRLDSTSVPNTWHTVAVSPAEARSHHRREPWFARFDPC